MIEKNTNLYKLCMYSWLIIDEDDIVAYGDYVQELINYAADHYGWDPNVVEWEGDSRSNS